MEMDMAHTEASLTKNPNQWRKYRNLRNLVNSNIKKDKISFNKNRFEYAEGNPKQQWETSKDLLGWSKGSAPTKLLYHNKMITKPKDTANALNLTYVTRVKKLMAAIPPTLTDPITNYRKIMNGKSPVFTLKKITIHQLTNTLTNMRPTHSSGIDNVSMKI
jgi:hypothetical protein